MFIVRINELKIYTKIGASIQERKKKQLLLVSIKFSYKVNNKKNIDHINNLISYTDIKQFLKTYIESSRCQTLEKLITECSQRIRRKFKIKNQTRGLKKSFKKQKLFGKIKKWHLKKFLP